jgi:hypothetical protein
MGSDTINFWRSGKWNLIPFVIATFFDMTVLNDLDSTS